MGKPKGLFDNLAGMNEINVSIPVNLMQDESSFSPVEYERLPRTMADQIDDCAAELLDPDRGRVVVVGPAQTGKTFFINQMIGNFDKYLEKVNTEKMIFVRLRKPEMESIASIPNGIRHYLDAVCAQFDCSDGEVCFVTEDPNIAAELFVFPVKSRIILEASHSTVSQIIEMESNGATKVWASWRFFDSTDIFFKKNELVNLLEVMLKDKMNDTYGVDLTKRTIGTFVKYVIGKIPGVLSKEDGLGEVIIVPIGIWAVSLRRLCGILGVSESPEIKNGKRTVLPKAIETVFENQREVFEAFADSADEDDEDGDGSMAIMLPGGQLLRFRNASESDEEDKGAESKEKDENPPLSLNISKLEKSLRSEIIGQDDAVQEVLDGLIVPAAGIQDPNKPLRSFLFLGPTGVGKTKTAKVIAENVSSKPLNLVRIDMSEYSQPHEAAKLLGAPPGYTGYDRGGLLTSAVIKNPHSVILLDEIEKAHPRIWDSFLQILDAGRMTDSHGKVADFTQSIIIMTSNLGADELARPNLGFSTLSENDLYAERQQNAKRIVLKSVEKNFRPELVNRIDEMIVFNELSNETARTIVRREIGIVSDRAKKSGYVLDNASDDIVDEILSKSNVSKYGAREVQRTVFKSVSNPLARLIVKDQKHSGGALSLSISDHVISVRKKVERNTDGEK